MMVKIKVTNKQSDTEQFLSCKGSTLSIKFVTQTLFVCKAGEEVHSALVFEKNCSKRTSKKILFV